MSSTLIPVTVITGFLGSGKTTLLSAVLARSRPGETAVIINEVAEIPLDQHIVGAAAATALDLVAGGCVCCDVQTDLVSAMRRLAASLGDRPGTDVLIETTGLADPIGIAEAIDSDVALREWFFLRQVITVVDSLSGLHTVRTYRESRAQVLLADKVILSKVDLVEPRDLRVLRAHLNTINPFAQMLEWRNDAKVANFCTDECIGVPAAWTKPGTKRLARRHQLESNCCFFDEPLTTEGVSAWTGMLAMFLGKRLLRLKALLNVDGIPTIVQGAQQFFYPPTQLPAWPTSDRRSQIVFICDRLHRSQLMATFDAFDLGRDCPPRAALGHARYKRFAEIAGRVRQPAL